jgi:hypothetical protein
MTNFVTTTTETVVEGNVVVPEYNEVERYLHMPQIPMTYICGNDQNILTWRRDTESGFSYLIKMTRQFLSAPASSTCAERIFSSAGKMHDDLKKSTNEATLESQLIVNRNYPYA